MLLSADAERRYITAILGALGAAQGEREAVANVLTEADLRGHGSHGMVRVPLNANLLRSGSAQPNARPRVIRESDATVLMDGDRALGPYAAIAAAEEAMARARARGIGAVAVFNCGHIALAGYYVELMARQDLIGLCFAKAEAQVHPYGGVQPRLGTNPIAVAVPSLDEPVLLDMSTSAMAHGKIGEAARAGRPLPEGVAFNRDGEPTTDAAAALAGALSPVGGAKGYGLSLIIEILAGVLTTAGTGPMRHPDGSRRLWGSLFIALDPERFCGLAELKQGVSALLATVKNTRLAPGFDEILIPGERSLRTRAERVISGVPIEDEVWQQVARIAVELGINPADYATA